MKHIVLMTIYQCVSEDDISNYAKRLDANPLMKMKNIGQTLKTKGKAVFETPPAIGKGNSVTTFEIIESTDSKSPDHSS